MTAWTQLARQVQVRANGRCEYCQMHDLLQGATFHVEHVVPGSAGGKTELENLAWACPSCNLRKSDRLRLRDPVSGDEVPLFDPRRERWNEHFQFVGLEIVALTPIGRALVAAFELNSEKRMRIRRVEELFGVFPSL